MIVFLITVVGVIWLGYEYDESHRGINFIRVIILFTPFINIIIASYLFCKRHGAKNKKKVLKYLKEALKEQFII